MIQTDTAISTALFSPYGSEVYKQLIASWGVRRLDVHDKGSKQLGVKKATIVTQAKGRGRITKVG